MPDMFSARQFPLLPHPALPAREAAHVDVAMRADQLDEGTPALRLTYRLSAAELLVPPTKPATRCHDLWQHTCAELFVGVDGEAGYREFNFSPSGQWAAYDFSAYRQRAATLPELEPPRIVSSVSAGGLMVDVLLARAAVPPGELSRLRWAVSAVLAWQDGARSYWALAHPHAQPDFHHRDGFVLTLD